MFFVGVGLSVGVRVYAVGVEGAMLGVEVVAVRMQAPNLFS